MPNNTLNTNVLNWCFAPILLASNVTVSPAI